MEGLRVGRCPEELQLTAQEAQMSIKLKNFEEYQAHALRTLAPGYTHAEDVMHAVMGMVGEVGEIMEHSPAHWEAKGDPRIGEIGDCMWYCAVLARRLSYNFAVVIEAAKYKQVKPTEFPEHTADVRASIYAARLMEVVKKVYFYKKTPDWMVVYELLVSYVAELLAICAFVGADPLYVAEVNVNKLATRFPDKFSEEKAINRDYAAESAATGESIK
jgi:hypothetical protein